MKGFSPSPFVSQGNGWYTLGMANTKRRARPSRSPKRKPATTRLVGYARVSTEEQAADGVSLDAQRERLNAYAKAHGFRMVRIEADEGVSGTKPPHQRAGLSAALALIAAGKADGLVVVRLDRLSRRSLDTVTLMESADREGWRLASVTESLDTGTPAGRMVVTVLAALAQHERDVIAERTSDAMRQLARENKVRGRFIPFGFRVTGFPHALKVDDIPKEQRPSPMLLTEHPAEQAVLAFMLDLREAGKGPRRIANALNENGGGNPRTRSPWTFGNVQNILRAYDRVTDAVEEGALR